MTLNIKHILVGVLSVLFFTSCEKDNITNAYFDENPERMDQVVEDLKEAMSSAPNGWVMMVKTTLSEDVYTPIILKFNPTNNEVKVRTVYGKDDPTKKDYFRITKGTGSPQLIFTTGSIMTTLYRVGAQASDITDHIYNVLKVSKDTIEIQPYRSGNVYAKEGGVVFKLFKRPADWTWADDEIKFDWTNTQTTTNVNAVDGNMKINYLKSNTSLSTTWKFWSWSDPTVYRIRDPFAIGYNIGTGGFLPSTYFILTGLEGVGSNVTPTTNSTITNGHNSLSFFPIPYNTGTNQNIVAIANYLKTHYLVLRNETRVNNNVKMEFEAYDKAGNVIVEAFYDNLR